ncbi:hypothetical protein TNCT_567821 [Trichonephila clavata]|uniref:Uncharacterized protein n=1 Tax=Trichonephila clavata TaxID=2740835 RepID=A0A8X6GM70_TRICU|nr:hypothetical protein TNCT_567821 [Trichonephila clavata]
MSVFVNQGILNWNITYADSEEAQFVFRLMSPNPSCESSVMIKRPEVMKIEQFGEHEMLFFCIKNMPPIIRKTIDLNTTNLMSTSSLRVPEHS